MIRHIAHVPPDYLAAAIGKPASNRLGSSRAVPVFAQLPSLRFGSSGCRPPHPPQRTGSLTPFRPYKCIFQTRQLQKN